MTWPPAIAQRQKVVIVWGNQNRICSGKLRFTLGGKSSFLGLKSSFLGRKSSFLGRKSSFLGLKSSFVGRKSSFPQNMLLDVGRTQLLQRKSAIG